MSSRELVSPMNEPFLEFEWKVAPGYEWADRLDEHGKPVVVPTEGLVSLRSPLAVERAWKRLERDGPGTGPLLRPLGKFAEMRRYRPMQREHAALFRGFERLDYRDRDAIRAFASTYGLLGVSDGFGESHLTWAREICLMREALNLTRSRTAGEKAEARAVSLKFGLDPLYEEQERRHRLAALFNGHLQGVQPQMTFEPEVPPRLSFKPVSLLAAMWLQLALAVVADKQFRTCKFCRRLFEISTDPTGFRSHREFCSDACKTQDYRRRKRTALTLAKGGVSLTAIADRIDTNKTTIRRWLGASGTQRKGKQ